MQLTLTGKPMDEIAIERIKQHAPGALAMNPAGYYVAYSGGKDSVVILDLVKRAGVPFRAVHHLTTCDPPELVKFVRQQREVEIGKPTESMWQLIRRQGMPPRRNARYCCRALKECGGDNSIVVTGVRWAESNRRSQRQMVEPCYRGGNRKFLHVIIDWTTSDVWAYIRERGLPYCSLYDEGLKRVGCVLCPMIEDVQRQIERWPNIARAWEAAIKATWKPNDQRWPSPQHLWEWWLDRRRTSKIDSHPVLFEDDPDLEE